MPGAREAAVRRCLTGLRTRVWPYIPRNRGTGESATATATATAGGDSGLCRLRRLVTQPQGRGLKDVHLIAVPLRAGFVGTRPRAIFKGPVTKFHLKSFLGSSRCHTLWHGIPFRQTA